MTLLRPLRHPGALIPSMLEFAGVHRCFALAPPRAKPPVLRVPVDQVVTMRLLVDVNTSLKLPALLPASV